MEVYTAQNYLLTKDLPPWLQCLSARASSTMGMAEAWGQMVKEEEDCTAGGGCTLRDIW